MLRSLKNPYIIKFLEMVDQDTRNDLLDKYEKACIDKFQGKITIEMQNINLNFRDNDFSSASELCKKARDIIIKFENEEMKVDYGQNDFNKDIWECRVEEVFFMKLFCLESAVKKNDALLLNFLPFLKQKDNVKRSFWANIASPFLNKFPDELINLYRQIIAGSIKANLCVANQTVIDEMKKTHADEVATLKEAYERQLDKLRTDNQALEVIVKEKADQVDMLIIDRNEWVAKFNNILHQLLQLRSMIESLVKKKEVVNQEAPVDTSVKSEEKEPKSKKVIHFFGQGGILSSGKNTTDSRKNDKRK